MKTKTTKLFLVVALTFAFAACKKGDTGPAGPAGPAATSGSFSYSQGGFIRGTVTGNKRDGTPFNLNFDNRFYYREDGFDSYDVNANYNFFIEKYPSSDPKGLGYCYIAFILDSLSSTQPSDPYFACSFTEDMGNNLKFYFGASIYSSNSNFIISNFTYDSTTHVAKGDFNSLIDGSDNSTTNVATVSGSFQTTPLTHYVYRLNKE